MTQADYSEKHRAENFLEILESMLKKYPPSEYAIKVSAILDAVVGNYHVATKWPPHFLIHSIEANCAYYRTNRSEILNEKN